jgi:uncharacterized protein with von Willebrand factor type A (vWA) domain
MIDLVSATAWVDIGRKADFRAVARCLLVHRREDHALFEAAFEAFWHKPAEGVTTLDLRSLGERPRARRSRFGPPPTVRPDVRQDARADAGSEGGPPVGPDEPPLVQVVRTWSAQEILRHKDFAELTGEEREAVATFIARLEWRVPERRTRRLRRGRGLAADFRSTLRGSLRHGGEVLEWARRDRKTKPRPLVVLADISGSMEAYTRLLLLFVHGLARGLGSRVEAFTFGTRLSRVTRALRGPDLERALRDVARAVPDWSGGTRIGEALRAFNRLWARRVLGGGPIVLLISDGWDRGEPRLLAEEMARLQRSCHRLVWLNPLLGASDYEPSARGMQAALPFVDDFLPVHSLASLQDLARQLERLEERGRRSQN